jgi:diguanylate cyclase (GGDEF)-like protein
VARAILAHPDLDPAASRETACVQVANAVVGMLMGTDPDPLLLDGALDVLELDEAVLDDVAVYAGQLGMSTPLATRGGRALADRIAVLEEQATTDDLTGLANRRHWKRLARERLAREGGAVMLCDVDHFKRVNDHNGHATGDLVLSEIARILSHHGTAGRLGGDELVLLANVAAHDARAAGDAILAQIHEAFPPGSIEGWDGGMSIGIALASADRRELTDLLKAADEALYEAKRAGRGRVALAP